MANNKSIFDNIESLTFFKEIELYEYCTLRDALYWIAFKIPPQFYYPYNNPGVRNDLSLCEEIGLPYAFDFDDFLIGKGICKKYNITEDPDIEFYEKNECPPSDKDSVLNSIKTFSDLLNKEAEPAKNKGFDRIIKSCEKELINNKDYYKQKEKYEYELNSFIDCAKFKLFNVLKDKDLIAEGLLFAKVKEDLQYIDKINSIDWLNNEDNWKEDEKWYKKDHVKISNNFWKFEYINWEDCYAQSLYEWYVHILIKTEDLMKLFAIDIDQCRPETIYSHNGFLFTNRNINELKSITLKGRPSKDWDSIYLKMQEILYHSQKQITYKSLLIDLQVWYQKAYNETIGESTLKEKIQPFFTLYKKSKNNI